MKRILLSIVILLTALTGVKAADDLVSLTFDRTGTDVASVTVNSSSTNVTAELVSLTGAATSFKGTAGNNLTNAVLCPDMNASASSGARVLTFKVDGLSGIAKIGVTILGLNGSGNYQNQAGPERSWNISCAASSSADGTPTVLATFDKNVTVYGVDSKFELMASDLAAIYRANEGEPIYLTLTITPTTTNGCFFGLSEIKLGAASAAPDPTPDPEEVVHTFSADKVYYIQWKNTGANYITENRDKSLTVADKNNSKYQFWKLIPVEGKSHCYKVQNVVTGNYMGSCNMTPSSSSRVTTSATAVEYYIGATAGSGEIAGCHYFSSTDCDNYSDETAGPRALNKDGASSYVITWTAGVSNVGSYWKIVETTEEYQAPEPPAHTEQTKALTVYFRPCGMVSNTYLAAATIGGVDPIAYTAAAKPGSFYVPFSKDHGAVERGSTFTVSITLNSNTDADLKANAYFDWNADGEFETTEAITLDGTAGTATVTVPDDAVSGDTRMRIRLNSNGLDDADDDVEGFVYDIPFAVVGGERKVLVDVNSADRGTASLSAAEGNHAVGTQLTATATPKGNAEFDSWREGGVVVSREATYTFAVANRNMTLKAYFTLNTEEPEEPEPSEATPAQWDFTFTRTSTTTASASVTNGGVAIEGVTATIAMSTDYKTGNQLDTKTNILCSTTNSSAATETAPIKYTLTIKNSTNNTYLFDYVEVSDVALNSEGAYQGTDVSRVRNFKVTYGSTTIGPEERYICDNQHCNGKEYPQGFGAKMSIPAKSTYTIVLDIYNINHDTGDDQIGSGCFYGLSKIALGNTTVSFGATGYATLYAPIALAIPEGVTAYTGTLNEDNTWLTLAPINNSIIPKEHAVILKGTAGEKCTFEEATSAGEAVPGNALKGQTSTVAKPTEGTVYTLQSYDGNEDGVNESVIFRKYLGDKVNGGRAYVVLPANQNGASAQSIGVRLEDGTTDIDVMETTDSRQQPTAIYDLFGRRVETMTKGGIYIVNGKKVVIR